MQAGEVFRNVGNNAEPPELMAQKSELARAAPALSGDFWRPFSSP